VGKPKGLKQILWERGLYVDGMLTHQTDTVAMRKLMDGGEGLPEHLDMKRVLARQPDFLAEKCALQQMIEDRGHIFLKSPACHPEIAGYGIEYCWGYSSTIFRKINDCTAANLEKNVGIALSNENLTLERVWKYSRRTRDYMRMYYKLAESLEDNPQLTEGISHKFYEENRNKIKLESRKLVCPPIVDDFLRHCGRQYSYHRNVAEIESNFINES